MLRRLLVFGLLSMLVLVAALVVEVAVPFRPSPQAVAAYMERSLRWEPRVGIPAPSPEQLLLLQPLDHWQIALTTNRQADGTPCFMLRYVTARRLSRPGTQISGGKCYSPDLARSSIQLHSLREHGYVVGGVITDPAIARLRATWLDGTNSHVAVENGVFLVVRADGVGPVLATPLSARFLPTPG